MHPDSPLETNHFPRNGLPPVRPPSGAFIARLFLTPMLIVGGLVGLGLTTVWLFGGPRTSAEFLNKLRNPNREIRWRTADDLAKTLASDEHMDLASDPWFALEVAQELETALKETEQAEHALAEGGRQNADAKEADDQTSLAAGQKYVLCLCSLLGNVVTPSGVMLLREMATREVRNPTEAQILRRRQAVWALANLGDKLRRFDALPTERQENMLETLAAETSASDGARHTWARLAYDALRDRQRKQPHTLGVDAALERCAKDDDPVLREFTAFALNFWEGDAEENGRIDEILTQLSYDDGHGDSKDAPHAGLQVRYNATRALARRGGSKIRLDVLAEMLDEPTQMQNFRDKDNPDQPDEAAARTTLIEALKAAGEWHKKNPARDVAMLLPAVERLAQSPLPALRMEADHTLQILRQK